jgi:predicted esterase
MGRAAARGQSPVAAWIPVEKTARYFTLAPADDDAIRELWFVLHGFGQLAATFVTYFGDLNDGTRRIVAPEALNRYYLVPAESARASERPVGATWMTREDREHEIADYVRYLDTLHAEVLRRSPRPTRIVVVGFSQGAATASRWAASGVARMDRLVLWGGSVPPEIDLSRGPVALGGVPVTLVVGERDQYVTPDLLVKEGARFAAGGFPYRLVRFDGGHVVSRTALRQLLADSEFAAS